MASTRLQRFFDRHPRVRIAFLALFVLFALVLIPRAWAFGEYFSFAVLVVCLPAPVYSLVRLLRAERRRQGDG